ncbi:MAG: T9SS type A sorting domain-containing protein [FCB group bacterium]|nr:T9SS type A sorting domain-containing protein [FCB group bacterium]
MMQKIHSIFVGFFILTVLYAQEPTMPSLLEGDLHLNSSAEINPITIEEDEIVENGIIIRPCPNNPYENDLLEIVNNQDDTQLDDDCLSPCADQLGGVYTDLIVAYIMTDGLHPNPYIKIKMSEDAGITFPTVCNMYSNSYEFDLPSIVYLYDRFVVIYVRHENGSTNSIRAFWRKYDGSDYGWFTIATGTNYTHPTASYRVWGYDFQPIAIFLDGNGSICWAYSFDYGESWNYGTLASPGTNNGIRFDGALSCSGYDPQHFAYIVYFKYSTGSVYCIRSNNGTTGWTNPPDYLGSGCDSSPWPFPVVSSWGSRVWIYWMDFSTNGSNTQLHYRNSLDAGGSWSGNWYYPWSGNMRYPSINRFMEIGTYAVAITFFSDNNNDRRIRFARHEWIDPPEPVLLYSEDEYPNALNNKSSTIVGGSNLMQFWSFWEDGNNNIYVDIEQNVSQNPEFYELSKNYPNPFNPSTTLTYSLPSAAEVLLTVYDVSGRHVATLAEGFQQPGSHTEVFDGQNLASGIYFATLQAGSFSQTQKLILLK